MASKNNSNSNKTAHVMNLLRKNNVAPTEENTENENNVETVQSNEEQQQNNTDINETQIIQKTNVQTTQQKPHVIASLNADTEISLNIRDALNDALTQDSEELEKMKSSEIDNTQQIEQETSSLENSDNNSGKTEIENSVNKNNQQEETEQADNITTSIHQETDKAETEQNNDSQISKAKTVEEYELINMMQLLVEEKIDKYMKMSGVCDCKKCRNDVLALALNKLSAKYVVMKKSEMILRTDMYKNRYSGEIIAQLLCACDKVKENPRH